MGDYQKELAIEKLKKATEMLELLMSRDSVWPTPESAPEFQYDVEQIIELIDKAKEHIANV